MLYSTVSVCTSQVLHPLSYNRIVTKKRMMFVILTIWIMSLSVEIPQVKLVLIETFILVLWPDKQLDIATHVRAFK